MIFVSSPYSTPDREIRKTRYLLARDFVHHIMQTMQCIAFSPIVYGHSFSENYQVPTDAQWWLAFNMNMLRRSESMFELKLNGWKESKGMQIERNIARMLNIPVVEFDHEFRNLTALAEKFGIEASIQQ